MRRHRYVLAITTALGLGLTACASPSTGSGGEGGGAGKEQAGGHLTVALAEAPDELDPTTAGTYVGRIVFINMCEPLFDVNEKLEIIPRLAASLPKISGDGKTYTIKLRDGIKFNDGTPFNAQAVKTTLERDINNERSNQAAYLTSVKSIDVVDPSTVRIELSEPYAPLTSILADRAGMILSPAQLKKMGDDFAKHPVCVGPFAFDSRPSSDLIELKKSQYYYDKDKVKLDRVTFKVVTQPSVRTANLRSGDIDIADRVDPSDVKSLEADPDIGVKTATSLGFNVIEINVSNSGGAGSPPYRTVSTPLAQHRELRHAFELSLDRNTINKVVFNGHVTPDCSPISPNSPYRTRTECTRRDIAKAKQLVAESGVPTPIPVTLMVEAGNSLDTKLGTVIQSMAKEAGFDVKVQPIEFTTALDQAKAGKFDTIAKKWSGRLDPDQNITPFWSPDSLSDYSGAHYTDVNRLLAQARATTDMAKRKQLYGQLVQKLHEHLNSIYLFHADFILGVRKNVTGVQYYGDTLIRLKTASLTSGG